MFVESAARISRALTRLVDVRSGALDILESGRGCQGPMSGALWLMLPVPTVSLLLLRNAAAITRVRSIKSRPRGGERQVALQPPTRWRVYLGVYPPLYNTSLDWHQG